jgi:hypothetical protein
MPAPATCPDRTNAPRFVSRESSALTITCDAPLSDGGSPVIAYKFSYYDTSDAAAFISTTQISAAVDAVAFNSRTVRITGLNDGRTYRFTCEAQNAVCYSAVSTSIDIQAGTVPC